jgi:hypothetical protein
MPERILRTCLFKLAKIAFERLAQGTNDHIYRISSNWHVSAVRGISSSVGQGLETVLCDTELYWDWMPRHNCQVKKLQSIFVEKKGLLGDSG